MTAFTAHLTCCLLTDTHMSSCVLWRPPPLPCCGSATHFGSPCTSCLWLLRVIIFSLSNYKSYTRAHWSQTESHCIQDDNSVKEVVQACRKWVSKEEAMIKCHSDESRLRRLLCVTEHSSIDIPHTELWSSCISASLTLFYRRVLTVAVNIIVCLFFHRCHYLSGPTWCWISSVNRHWAALNSHPLHASSGSW